MEPLRAPDSLRKSVIIRVYADANQEGNILNMRSQIDIPIYVNNAPIIWFSKQKNSVESSSFGSELISLRIATEMMEALR